MDFHATPTNEESPPTMETPSEVLVPTGDCSLDESASTQRKVQTLEAIADLPSFSRRGLNALPQLQASLNHALRKKRGPAGWIEVAAAVGT